MTPFFLSTTGVSFAVLGHNQVAGREGVIVFGKVFCQTDLPVSASTANKVSSAASRKITSLAPPDVETPSTTSGAVSVDSAMSVGFVGSCVLHFTFNLETLLFERTFSPLFQAVRSWS